MDLKKFIYLAIILAAFSSCDLEELPKDTATSDEVFGTESGLEAYTNSFYGIFPDQDEAHKQDVMCDYSVVSSVTDFMRKSSYTADESEGWDWEDLRNINYFIQNCTNENVDEDTRNNYLGLAHFFRAYFYFQKVVRFGDVPWINKAMEPDDPDLYAARDSRTLVMDSVLADLDFAVKNITQEDDTRSLVTKYVALGFKSRICLFEGTFRKYHTELGLTSTAGTWLTEAADAAKEVMDDSGFSINTSGNQPYRDLFISESPVSSEVMLADVCDPDLGVTNDANWWWTSSTYGSRVSLCRTFVNTYLKTDGTDFTSTSGYESMTFMDEVKNRDKRLQQTIRLGDYTRINSGVTVAAPPVFSYTYTGYQPIKYVLDDMYYDADDNNYNSIPLMRYAEILLNYAEAKAELGTLTDAEWAETIGVLRSRAGITSGLDAKPTIADTYLQTNYFPDITDPVILEVRRERAIELVFEGFRFRDLLRWKRGELMEMEWNGFYVPKLDVAMDLNEDGTDDVVFTQNASLSMDNVEVVNVAPTVSGVTNSRGLKNGTYGELTWLDNDPRYWEDKKYYYPIPSSAIVENPNLTQNEGW